MERQVYPCVKGGQSVLYLLMPLHAVLGKIEEHVTQTLQQVNVDCEKSGWV